MVRTAAGVTDDGWTAKSETPGAGDATGGAQPVEYAVAVRRYLDAAPLSTGSRRVYRISLEGWAWALVGRTPPTGSARRGATVPVVPLALLDHPQAPARLSAALTTRTAVVGPRTVRRELSVLRAAVGWWRDQGWIARDPLPADTSASGSAPSGFAAPSRAPGPGEAPLAPGDAGGLGDPGGTGVPGGTAAPPETPVERGPLSEEELRALFALPASLRELTLWQLRYESGAPPSRLLALDTGELDLPARRTRTGVVPPVSWAHGAARLLPLLIAGRPSGPLFLTTRRAATGTPAADRCPITGRARLSYRRAAELLSDASRELSPEGRGWSLRQLTPPPTGVRSPARTPRATGSAPAGDGRDGSA